ncbi:hypothetical protein H4582DRAFT_2047235 [Lactarius indigo]|nr:hypothetical protein H4582DRAFT_2047235 [Lactarius indigo]
MDSSQTPLTPSALKATKSTALLPIDLPFHRSVDSDLARDLEACLNKVISITNVLLNLTSIVGNPKNAKGKGKARLRDEDDFLDRFGSLVVEPMSCLNAQTSLSINPPVGPKPPSLPSIPESLKRWLQEAAMSLLYSMLHISRSRNSSSSGRSITPMASYGPPLCDISSTRVCR